MPFGQHVARCFHCGTQWIVGDCIPSICRECEAKGHSGTPLDCEKCNMRHAKASEAPMPEAGEMKPPKYTAHLFNDRVHGDPYAELEKDGKLVADFYDRQEECRSVCEKLDLFDEMASIKAHSVATCEAFHNWMRVSVNDRDSFRCSEYSDFIKFITVLGEMLGCETWFSVAREDREFVAKVVAAVLSKLPKL